MTSSTTEIILKSAVSADYDEFYSDGASAWRELGAKFKAKNIIEVCNRGNFKPRRILEVGAGEGSVLMHLRAAGFGEEYHALEISRSGIAAIEKRAIQGVSRVSWFNGYELPYENDAFDAVILCHVLEHVEYERVLLRELRRVAPRHLIEVPLDYRPGVDKNYAHCLSYGHINVYSPTLIRFLLRSEGFAIDQELLTIVHEEVMEYIEFVTEKKERTASAVAEFQKRMSDRALKFYTAPSKDHAEAMANAITLLTSRDAQGLKVFSKA
ncbi:MAG: class I SAM-dependent methyltransferase [Rhodospirillaceae bacterium]